MKNKSLLRKWSSVSAAAAVLLGSNRAPANNPVPETDAPKIGDGDTFEPLILKPPGAKVIPEERFAGHRSHASHASHRSHASHYSGSSGYQPDFTPARTPTYLPPVATPTPVPPTYPPAHPVASVQPQVEATTPPPVNRIELANGTSIYGNLLTKSAAGITLKGWDGKTYKFERNRLSARTIAEIGLPEERSAGAPQSTPQIEKTDAAGLRQKNEDLEQTISTLRRDNAALREQVRGLAAKPSSTGTGQVGVPSPPNASSGTQDTSQAYWLSGTGKRHNKNCRYYGTGHGHPCGPNDGVPCKICGG